MTIHNSNIHNKRGLIQKTNYIKIKNNSQQTIDGRINIYNMLWVYFLKQMLYKIISLCKTLE